MNLFKTVVAKILICICSVFIILFTSFTAYNYFNNNILPKRNTSLTKEFYECNSKELIKPFKISDKDIIRYDKCSFECSNVYTKYTIKKGDTLYSIARSNISWCSPSTAVKKIVEINTLKNANSITAGQQILLPVN